MGSFTINKGVGGLCFFWVGFGGFLVFRPLLLFCCLIGCDDEEKHRPEGWIDGVVVRKEREEEREERRKRGRR